MNYLIIGCHPYSGSFDVAMIENIKKALTEKGDSVSHIDLVADGFDPVMSAQDLNLWRTGQYDDELVGKYIDELKKADFYIFPFPIWWGLMPAVLKGFFDKVFLPGFAYKYGEKGEMVGLLTGKSAVVITTMETSADIFNGYLGNPVEGMLLKNTLNTCGIVVLKHFAIDNIISGGRDYTEEKMKEVVDYFKKLK